MGRPATGLVHDKLINFRTDLRGQKRIKRRMKANRMNQSEYLRHCIELEEQSARDGR